MNNYKRLLSNINSTLDFGRKQVYYSVNYILVKTYWRIGQQVVEYEQDGKERARYGSSLLDKLSQDLKLKYGQGFSRDNLESMRRFYLLYPKSETLSRKLTWSHYRELLKMGDKLERHFYEKQSVKDNWSIRELKRQINSALFYRLVLNKNKKSILELSKKGQIIENPKDLVKDPYILEFLNLPEKHSEKQLEQKIIDNLQKFLFELGRGFTFVARQYRITLDNRHYYIDIVFYNRILKCFVLIDLKLGDVTPEDIGQMNLYLNYFKREENNNDNEPIGIVLGTKNNNLTIKYALGGISNNLFVSKYKLFFPNKKELEHQVNLNLPKSYPQSRATGALRF